MTNLEKREHINAKMVSIVLQLQQMDYMTSKYVDGGYTKEQWNEIAAKRKSLRTEYNALEAELKSVNE